MIDLKQIIEQHPDAEIDAQKLKGILSDLYPNETASIAILTAILKCGIVEEIKISGLDPIRLDGYVRRLESDFGYSPKLSQQCLHLWSSVYYTIPVISSPSTDNALQRRNNEKINAQTENISEKEQHTKRKIVAKILFVLLVAIGIVLFLYYVERCNTANNSSLTNVPKTTAKQQLSEPPPNPTSIPFWKSVKRGEIIELGKYEQDNNLSNGNEPIEWIVLEVKEGKALLLSKYGLDSVKYNDVFHDVTWETSSIRQWLNNNFRNRAFTTGEQSIILTTVVNAEGNPEFSSKSGKDTVDKIFLPSINEVNQYFENDESRKGVPTAYAKARGVYTDSNYTTAKGIETCRYWLRNLGCDQLSATYVTREGYVYNGGHIINSGAPAIRPAMWISIEH